MSEKMRRVALCLRWLAVLWLVGWSVYATVSDDWLVTPHDTRLALTILLGPAFAALVLAWVLDRDEKELKRP